MTPARTRRAILFFLLILTIVVFVRIASSAEGAAPSRTTDGSRRADRTEPTAAGAISLRLQEPGALVAGGSTLHRTISLAGLRAGSHSISLDWEAHLEGVVVARGQGVAAPRGGAVQFVLSVPLLPVDGPAGLDIRVTALDSGAVAGEATFPFLVYPVEEVERIAALFGRARVALYDPQDGAAQALAALGIRPQVFDTFEDLALYSGDLIVVGPGGFGRGREALGPILAARIRTGMRLLLLEQPTLPGTLSEDLRLWPSFSKTGETTALVATRHPVNFGLRPAGSLDTGPLVRPLLPPTRGNFRVISEMRVRTGPAWQEGVTLLELPIGSGTVLAAQSSLCAGFAREPGSRLLFANAVAYLLDEGRRLKRTFLYGDSVEDLPSCLARLAPGAARVPADFAGVEVLLVAGDWQAPRLAAAANLPPVADVARYLRTGGTVLLVNPQPLSFAYLQAVTGVPVYFTSGEDVEAPPAPESPLLEGIAPEDLWLIGRERGNRFRLRSLPERGDVEPILLVPGISQYRVGRGVLVALSLPDATDCAAPRTSSLLARLLTNLGVPLDHAPGIDPDAVSRLGR